MQAIRSEWALKRPGARMFFPCRSQAGARPATWQTVHYYKLQHAFFVHYHTSNPVYASWGPEKNPPFLREPGVNACEPGATAKAFAARGAAKRARRRMAAFKTSALGNASACHTPKAVSRNPHLSSSRSCFSSVDQETCK